MKLEPIWKPFTTIKEIPYRGTFLVNFNNYLGMQTTFVQDKTLRGYPNEKPLNICKIPEDNEFFATLVSETFSATGYVLGIDWEGYIKVNPCRTIPSNQSKYDLDYLIQERLGYNSLADGISPQRGALLKIETTTTVSIQGYLFTNVSESIEFVGELTEEQKETLRGLL